MALPCARKNGLRRGVAAKPLAGAVARARGGAMVAGPKAARNIVPVCVSIAESCLTEMARMRKS